MSKQDDPRLGRLLKAYDDSPVLIDSAVHHHIESLAAVFLIFWDAMQAERTEADWQPVASCPLNTWVKTRLEGEAGENECFARIFRAVERDRCVTLTGKVSDQNDATDTAVEWVSRDGRSTSMHHSFAAPSHWRPL